MEARRNIVSKKTDNLEMELEKLGRNNIGKLLPEVLPDWMITEGILSGSVIESSARIGGQNSKTDVIYRLANSEDIKISAKLGNADYFGNWYGHERIFKEFSIAIYEKLTEEITKWANEWVKKEHSDIFVGVCASFGKRSGDTTIKFIDVFDEEDAEIIARGHGSGEKVANALFIGDKCPANISELICQLQEINTENIKKAIDKFYIICRPVNPMTNVTNRGKCVYTRFQPYRRLAKMTEVKSIDELMELGKFVSVDWRVSYKLNTNKILEILKDGYNICIPKK